jgi:hypothetical protein
VSWPNCFNGQSAYRSLPRSNQVNWANSGTVARSIVRRAAGREKGAGGDRIALMNRSSIHGATAVVNSGLGASV